MQLDVHSKEVLQKYKNGELSEAESKLVKAALNQKRWEKLQALTKVPLYLGIASVIIAISMLGYWNWQTTTCSNPTTQHSQESEQKPCKKRDVSASQGQGTLAGKKDNPTQSIEAQINATINSMLLKSDTLNIETSHKLLKKTRYAFNKAILSVKQGKSIIELDTFANYIYDMTKCAETIEDKYILALCYAQNGNHLEASELLKEIIKKPLPLFIEKKQIEELLALIAQLK